MFVNRTDLVIVRNGSDMGKYVFGCLNDGRTHGKVSYSDGYFLHDYLIYGYDDKGFTSVAYL